ncbi:hypothetical protein pb186bvf_005596 [Paramecium bursaria]
MQLVYTKIYMIVLYAFNYFNFKWLNPINPLQEWANMPISIGENSQLNMSQWVVEKELISTPFRLLLRIILLDKISLILQFIDHFEDIIDYDRILLAIDRKISGSIQFQNVFFQYPSSIVQVLQALDFSINPGEYVAFVGGSGSGKSTIIQLIERFYDPQEGNIYLDNLNIKQFKLKDLRRQIGLVSQETYLFEGTIQSNIIYGTDNYSQEDFDWATKASGVQSFVNNKDQFPNGFKTFVGEHGFTLSGGQKQRIAIARALIKRPKILIFDEATSALDAESEYQVQCAIDQLVKQEKKSITIIIIAHRLSTIVNCNRIFVLQTGTVVEMGTHQELLQRDGIYRQLVERQMVDNLKSDVDGETMAQ